MRHIFAVLVFVAVLVCAYSAYHFYFNKDYLVFQYTEEGMILEKESVIPPCRGDGSEECVPFVTCESGTCLEITCDSEGPVWALELLECGSEEETEEPEEEIIEEVMSPEDFEPESSEEVESEEMDAQ
jgi:hypothetical protein